MTKLFLASLLLISAFVIAQSALVGSFHGSGINNKSPKGYSDRVGATPTLPPTSETKSLFLLGGGLMGLASATLLLKAARQPAAYSTAGDGVLNETVGITQEITNLS